MLIQSENRLNVASKIPRKGAKYIRVPAETVLNSHILVQAMAKLETTAIRRAVECLIDELDKRDGEPDFEAEVLEESL